MNPHWESNPQPSEIILITDNSKHLYFLHYLLLSPLSLFVLISLANIHQFLRNLSSLTFDLTSLCWAALQDAAGIVQTNFKAQNKTWSLRALRSKPDTARSPFSSHRMVCLEILRSIISLAYKLYNDTPNLRTETLKQRRMCRKLI